MTTVKRINRPNAGSLSITIANQNLFRRKCQAANHLLLPSIVKTMKAFLEIVAVTYNQAMAIRYRV